MAQPGLANLVAQTSISTGTESLSLNTILGRQSFAAAFGITSEDTFFYFISNPNAGEWEVGIGHLSDISTMARDTVLDSSNSGALVNFTAGTKQVVNDLPAAYQSILVQPGYRLITAPGDVTVAATDKTIEINKAAPATTIVHVDPTILTVGKYVTIKLSKDDGATNQVTITPTSGDCDGGANFVLSYPWQAITFYSNGTSLRGVA